MSAALEDSLSSPLDLVWRRKDDPCFNEYLHGQLPAGASEEQKEKMGKVAPAIKDQMQNNGQALVGFQSVNGFPNFWRLVLANVWSVTFSDVDTILETFDRIGREL